MFAFLPQVAGDRSGRSASSGSSRIGPAAGRRCAEAAAGGRCHGRPSGLSSVRASGFNRDEEASEGLVRFHPARSADMAVVVHRARAAAGPAWRTQPLPQA